MKSNCSPEPLVTVRSHEEGESLTRNHDQNIYNSAHPKEWESQYLMDKYRAYKYTPKTVTFSYMSYEDWAKDHYWITGEE